MDDIIDKWVMFILGVGAMMIFLIAMKATPVDMRNKMQKEAIEKGFAEMVIDDPIKGTTQFKWKEPIK